MIAHDATRRRVLAGLAGIACGLTFDSLHAQQAPARVNLGTLAPRGSSFHQSLEAMAQAWRNAPGGGVRLVIYPDGAQGSEADMVRLMRVGTLQAGLLTAVGLSEIVPGVIGLQNYPLLFRDYAEFDYVTSKLTPMLAERLLAKGFVALFWADAGWIRYFFKHAVLTPQDMRKVRTFVWSGSVEQYRMMRDFGYNPVLLETADVLQGLATDQITGISVPPIFALVSQFEKRAPHMLDLNWAPLVGACVIRKDVWEHLAPQTRSALQTAADQAAARIRANNRRESEQAIEKMKANGLTVHVLDAEQRAAWQRAAEELYPRIRGNIVPADIHDQVMRLVAAYRAGDR
jgi:TRAP-type transport system periplasmic protein